MIGRPAPSLIEQPMQEDQMVDRLFWIANLGVMVAIVVLGGVAMVYVAG
jgi:hypothetical protein